MAEWRNWKESFLFFWRNKVYVLFLSLTAVFGYGFLVTHQTVGIDDTPYAYYFEEGLNAIVGRWFLYVANKLCRISDFSPFITDLAGVLILMAAVSVWCVLLHSVCGDKVSVRGYLFFGCIFISCPLISEVYTYYLHNGISVGYLCTGISLCFFRTFGQSLKDKRKALPAGLGTAVFLWLALGCYESFMIVWLLGVLLVLLTEKYMGVRNRVILSLALAAGAAVAAVVLRSAMISAVIAVFDLGGMRDEAVQRSIGELLGWMLEEGAFAEFAMALKRAYVMYGVFAYAYYPIKIFVLSAAVMTVFSLWRGVRQKSGWIPVLTLGSFAVCFLLILVEGKVTLYRAAQFLPVVCGYGAFLTVYASEGLGRCVFLKEKAKGLSDRAGRLADRVCRGAAAFALCAVLWNQCYDMNKWFYVDWLKYEAALDTMEQLALELHRNFDASKPVVFTGNYEIPRDIIADAYVWYGTETFFKFKRWTDPVDEHLLDKFYRDYGIWVAQTPALSVIEWGRYAFGDDSELVRFFAMHGYELVPYTASENYEALEVYSLELPEFPREGSVVDVGDCIVVHF